MQNDLTDALNQYNAKWKAMVEGVNNKQFFSSLKPVAVGWKVSDEQEYGRLYNELRGDCDRIVETWMNGRWVAKMHLISSTLPGGISIIKLMQRRPGSQDSTGLDHVDFYSPEVVHAEEILQKESVKWSKESNDVIKGYEWISVWFDDTEAKLKADTVVDIVIQELEEVNTRIKL